MTKYVSKEGKKLLHNTIQSLNSQNKIIEQNLMWKMYEKKRSPQNDSKLDYKPRKRRKVNHDDHDHSDNFRASSSNSNKDNNNYWTKRLVKEEEKQPERWGHNGYKELYPEQFQSIEESSSSDDTQSNGAVKHKSKRKKSKKKKSKKHKKHRRK